MKYGWLGLVLATAAVVAALLSMSTAPALPALDEPTVARAVLSNGLRVLVHEDRRADHVAVVLWLRVGSRFEAAGHSGLAHLSEHLAFLAPRSGQPDMRARIESLGGTECNGTTGYDRTRLFLSVPRRALSEALRIQADQMRTLPLLTRDRLARGVAELEAEIGRKQLQPDTVLRQALLRDTVPDGHPYARIPLGELNEIRALGLGTVREWLARHYTPDNAVLVMVGDVAVEEALAIARTHFNGPSGHRERTVAFEPALPIAPVERTFHRSGPQDRVFLIWNLPGFRSNDADGLDLLRHILEARLSEGLGGATGIARAITVRFGSFEWFGQLTIDLEPRPGVDKARLGMAAQQEIDALLSSGPTRREIATITRRLVESLREDLAQPRNAALKADLFAQSELFYGGPTGYLRFFERLRAVDSHQVRTLARKWLARGKHEFLVSAADTSSFGPRVSVR